jgi:hypothetical protein
VGSTRSDGTTTTENLWMVGRVVIQYGIIKRIFWIHLTGAKTTSLIRCTRDRCNTGLACDGVICIHSLTNYCQYMIGGITRMSTKRKLPKTPDARTSLQDLSNILPLHSARCYVLRDLARFYIHSGWNDMYHEFFDEFTTQK